MPCFLGVSERRGFRRGAPLAPKTEPHPPPSRPGRGRVPPLPSHTKFQSNSGERTAKVGVLPERRFPLEDVVSVLYVSHNKLGHIKWGGNKRFYTIYIIYIYILYYYTSVFCPYVPFYSLSFITPLSRVIRFFLIIPFLYRPDGTHGKYHWVGISTPMHV